MRALVLVAALAASPALAECLTTCGLSAPLEGPQACRELQAAEDKALASFAAHVTGWTRSRTCPALLGWTILVELDSDAEGVFMSQFNGHRVLGQTIPSHHLILLGLDRWGDSAFAHELVHVISYAIEKDLTHDQWTERGLCRAINDASGRFRCHLDDPSIGSVDG